MSTTFPAVAEVNLRLLGAGLLALLVLAVYLPSFRGGFVWDDLLLIDQNPLVKGEFNLRTIWFSTDFPLSNVALWLEWLVFGKHTPGYRVVNPVLHAASSVCCFGSCWRSWASGARGWQRRCSPCNRWPRSPWRAMRNW